MKTGCGQKCWPVQFWTVAGPAIARVLRLAYLPLMQMIKKPQKSLVLSAAAMGRSGAPAGEKRWKRLNDAQSIGIVPRGASRPRSGLSRERPDHPSRRVRMRLDMRKGPRRSPLDGLPGDGSRSPCPAFPTSWVLYGFQALTPSGSPAMVSCSRTQLSYSESRDRESRSILCRWPALRPQ